MASSGVTVGNRKAHPFLPMLSWLYGQLAGVACMHGILSHTVISIGFDVETANAGMACEASWLALPVYTQDRFHTSGRCSKSI